LPVNTPPHSPTPFCGGAEESSVGTGSRKEKEIHRNCTGRLHAMTAPTTAKGPYLPKKREWVICPQCGKRFSVMGAEYRYRIKTGKKEPCCSKECGGKQRKNNSH